MTCLGWLPVAKYIGPRVIFLFLTPSSYVVATFFYWFRMCHFAVEWYFLMEQCNGGAIGQILRGGVMRCVLSVWNINVCLQWPPALVAAYRLAEIFLVWTAARRYNEHLIDQEAVSTSTATAAFAASVASEIVIAAVSIAMSLHQEGLTGRAERLVQMFFRSSLRAAKQVLCDCAEIFRRVGCGTPSYRATVSMLVAGEVGAALDVAPSAITEACRISVNHALDVEHGSDEELSDRTRRLPPAPAHTALALALQNASAKRKTSEVFLVAKNALCRGQALASALAQVKNDRATLLRLVMALGIATSAILPPYFRTLNTPPSLRCAVFVTCFATTFLFLFLLELAVDGIGPIRSDGKVDMRGLKMENDIGTESGSSADGIRHPGSGSANGASGPFSDRTVRSLRKTALEASAHLEFQREVATRVNRFARISGPAIFLFINFATDNLLGLDNPLSVACFIGMSMAFCNCSSLSWHYFGWIHICCGNAWALGTAFQEHNTVGLCLVLPIVAQWFRVCFYLYLLQMRVSHFAAILLFHTSVHQITLQYVIEPDEVLPEVKLLQSWYYLSITSLTVVTGFMKSGHLDCPAPLVCAAKSIRRRTQNLQRLVS
jgi:hypothetical protein